MGETLVLIGASCQRPCGFPAHLLWERTRREQSGLKNCRFCSEVGDSCILGCRCPEPVSAGRRHRCLTLLVAASMQTAWGPSMDPANSCAPPTAATGSAVSGRPPRRWSSVLLICPGESAHHQLFAQDAGIVVLSPSKPFIALAALLVNVMATMVSWETPNSCSRYAICCVKT